MSIDEKPKSDGSAPSDLPSDPAVSYDPHQTNVFADVIEAASATVVAPAEETPLPEGSDDIVETMSLLLGTDPDHSGFRLRKLMGKGGFGEIWEAEQQSLSRIIAVKRLREELEEKAQSDASAWRRMKQSFLQEALTTANLEHPNILPIYDLGIDEDGRPVLAMKLIRGRPWSEMITLDATLPMEDFLARHLPILIDVAQAVAFAHSRGVLHRDIKPAQVMVGEFGEVMLADWGLAVVYDEDKVEPKHLRSRFADAILTTKNASSPSGTVAFMAPEQTLKTSDSLGPWTDIYLLGGTLYYLLTFSYPHNAPDVKAAFAQARNGFVEPPEERRPEREAPPELSRLCQWMLQVDPRKRPENVRTLINELNDYLSGSSSRRESRQLTEDIEKRYWQGCQDYDQLDMWENQLAQALGMWPGNRQARTLLQQVISDYTDAAISSGDLMLARVEARRIENGKERERQEAAIADRQEQHERHRRQRRFFFYTTVGLLFAAAILAFLSNMRRIEAERSRGDAESNLQMAMTALESAQFSRRSADSARQHAEDLIRFMMSQLKRERDPEGTRDQLGLLVEEARRSLAEQEPTPELRDTIESEARSLHDVAVLLASNDALGQALDSIHYCNEISEVLADRFSEESRLKLQHADWLKVEGELLRRAGKLDESKTHLRRSMEIASTVESDEGLLPQSQRVRGEALLSLGRIESAQSAERQARVLWEEAVRLLRTSNDSQPNPRTRRALAMSLLFLDRREEAQRYVDEQLALGEENSELARMLRMPRK